MPADLPIEDDVLRMLRGHQPPPNVESAVGSLVTKRLSDIESKPVHWLWHGRIARGKLTIFAGNPGLGKSQITASIAAIVTTGGCWPVDRTQCAAGDVLFLTAEDDAADTLRPRLEAAGADLRRVHIIEGVVAGYTGDGGRHNRVFSLQQDLPGLSSKLTELGTVAAVFIDPISAYLGDTDSHKNAEVRALLTPISELAAKHDAAIIGVSHLTKSVAPDAMMRVSGSLAFVAAARAAYLVAPDPEDKARRLFLPMKNNLGPDATGLAYRIEGATVHSKVGPLETSRIAWEGAPVAITADELMQSSAPQRTSALTEAVCWLNETLAGGPMPANEVFKLAEAIGIRPQTLRRAREDAGVVTEKASMAGGWLWSLRPKMFNAAEDAQEKSLNTFDEFEHLQEGEGSITEVDL